MFKATTSDRPMGEEERTQGRMSEGEEREGSPLPWGAALGASNPAGEEEEVLISEFR